MRLSLASPAAIETRMHSAWFSGVDELHARVPVSRGAGGFGVAAAVVGSGTDGAAAGAAVVGAGFAISDGGVATTRFGCDDPDETASLKFARGGSDAGAAAGAAAGDAAGAGPADVSRSAASGSRYAPIESTRSVSRFASARSAASAESAANSSAVLEGLPESHASASIAIAIVADERACRQIIMPDFFSRFSNDSFRFEELRDQ